MTKYCTVTQPTKSNCLRVLRSTIGTCVFADAGLCDRRAINMSLWMTAAFFFLQFTTSKSYVGKKQSKPARTHIHIQTHIHTCTFLLLFSTIKTKLFEFTSLLSSSRRLFQDKRETLLWCDVFFLF